MDFEYTPPQTPLEIAFGGFRAINAFGKITRGDSGKFERFLQNSEIPPRTDVYINSNGGDPEEAIEIGRLIRSAWLSTHIGEYILSDEPNDLDNLIKKRKFNPGKCMSAATLLFIAGRLRYFDNGSEFGIHRFSFQNPTSEHVAHSQIISAKIAAYISEMGASPQLLLLSSQVAGDQIRLLAKEELLALGVVTGGETSVEWTMQARNGTLYVRGERDSIYGHHKVMITKVGGQFLFHAVIEAQGRQDELTNFPVIEIVTWDEEHRIDISQRSFRQEINIYVSVICKLSADEAHFLLHSKGWGVQIRSSPQADLFLGIAPMSTSGSEDILTSFASTIGV